MTMETPILCDIENLDEVKQCCMLRATPQHRSLGPNTSLKSSLLPQNGLVTDPLGHTICRIPAWNASDFSTNFRHRHWHHLSSFGVSYPPVLIGYGMTVLSPYFLFAHIIPIILTPIFDSLKFSTSKLRKSSPWNRHSPVSPLFIDKSYSLVN